MLTLNDLEHQLAELTGHPVPPDYVELLKNYPEPLRLAARSAVDDASEGFVADVELPAAPEIILALNHEARSGTILDPAGHEFCWPDGLLVIGETGTGDYYCLDASGDFAGVLQYDHQEVEFYDIADSLPKFVALLKQSFLKSH